MRRRNINDKTKIARTNKTKIEACKVHKMKKKITVIIILAVACVAAGIYFAQGDWCETQGWSGEYNSESVERSGLEGIELKCSQNTRIVYSYIIKSGGVELKVTRDADGQDVVKSVIAEGENNSGVITFENKEYCTYYLYETALSKDSDYICEGRYEVYRTKFKQLLIEAAFRLGLEDE